MLEPHDGGLSSNSRDGNLTKVFFGKFPSRIAQDAEQRPFGVNNSDVVKEQIVHQKSARADIVAYIAKKSMLTSDKFAGVRASL